MSDSVNSVSSPASVAGPLAVPPVAQAGDSLAEVATPSLLLDLDAFDANVARMASAASARGVAVRPHAKAHKSVTIARAQVAAGAVGVCCQKLTEAIPFVNAGIGSIHISNEFVGQARVALAVAMAARVSLSVCVDDVRQVAPLGKAAQRAGVRIAVLPEVDVGQGRCGVDSTEALGRLEHETTWTERVALVAGLTAALLVELVRHDPLRTGEASQARPLDRPRAIACLAPVALACGLATMEADARPETDLLEIAMLAVDARLDRIVDAFASADPRGDLTAILAALLAHLP